MLDVWKANDLFFLLQTDVVQEKLYQYVSKVQMAQMKHYKFVHLQEHLELVMAA